MGIRLPGVMRLYPHHTTSCGFLKGFVYQLWCLVVFAPARPAAKGWKKRGDHPAGRAVPAPGRCAYIIFWPLISSAKSWPNLLAARRHSSMRERKISKYSEMLDTSWSMRSCSWISFSASRITMRVSSTA